MLLRDRHRNMALIPFERTGTWGGRSTLDIPLVVKIPFPVHDPASKTSWPSVLGISQMTNVRSGPDAPQGVHYVPCTYCPNQWAGDGYAWLRSGWWMHRLCSIADCACRAAVRPRARLSIRRERRIILTSDPIRISYECGTCQRRMRT